ncbi:uncharacterized protein [Venturia canescens]|uniref:uncharacterized protein n=1 Tax=Venturia canescens TaxID=32260 RepID=UPI001C9C0BE7|nr:uncharacterized protein LOC122410691 [Venturia canescens]
MERSESRTGHILPLQGNGTPSLIDSSMQGNVTTPQRDPTALGNTEPQHTPDPFIQDNVAPLHTEERSMQDNLAPLNTRKDPSMHDYVAPLYTKNPTLQSNVEPPCTRYPSVHDYVASLHTRDLTMRDNIAPLHTADPSMQGDVAPLNRNSLIQGNVAQVNRNPSSQGNVESRRNQSPYYNETRHQNRIPSQRNATPQDNCNLSATRTSSETDNRPNFPRHQETTRTPNVFRENRHENEGQHQMQPGFYQQQWQNELWPHRNEPIVYVSQESVNFVISELRSLRNLFQTEMRKMRNLYERELMTDFPIKPNSLPLSSPEEVTAFENIPDKEYKDIKTYLGSLGGHTLVETANEMLKNTMKDSVSQALTWHGRKPNEISLGKSKFAKALYASVARNRSLPKPNWSEFTEAMVNALRSSKQCYRNSLKRMEDINRNHRNVNPTDGRRATNLRHNEDARNSDDSEFVEELRDRGRQNFRDRLRSRQRIRRDSSSSLNSARPGSPDSS